MRLLFLLLSSLSLINAATLQWQGLGDDWTGQFILSERWSGAVVPGPADDVIIGVDAPKPFDVQFPRDAAFQSLKLASGSRLLLQGHTLTVMTLDIDFSQGFQGPITIEGGNLIVKQGWNMVNINSAAPPTLILAGTTVTVNQGCNVLFGSTLTSPTSTKLTIDFRTTQGQSSSIINRGDFRIKGNVPVIFNGASDLTSMFQHPSDAQNANFIIERTKTMLNSADDGARLLTASNMQFEFLSGIVHLTADNTVTITNTSEPMDLTNYANTKENGYVVELPQATATGTWVLSYPARISCSAPISTVSIMTQLQVYGATISCEAVVLQKDAVVDLMTPSTVAKGQAMTTGTLQWQGILISGAKSLNLRGNTLSVSRMTTAFSYTSATTTAITDGTIVVNQLWVIEAFNTASPVNTLQLQNVIVNVAQGGRWQMGAYLNQLAGSNPINFKFVLSLKPSSSSGSVSSSINNRGFVKLVGNVPIEWIGNNDDSSVFEQPIDAEQAQFNIERSGNVNGRDASNMFTLSGMQVRILAGDVMLAADLTRMSPQSLNPNQFEESVSAGMVQSLPSMPKGGSGRFILSYPARVLCTAPIITGVIRGEIELWGPRFACAGLALASTATIHLKSATGISYNDAQSGMGGDFVLWNETSVFSSAAQVNGYGHTWVLRDLVTDFRVMGLTPSTTISNAIVTVSQRWTINSYTTSTSGIANHRVILDNSTVMIGPDSVSVWALGPQTAPTAPGAVAAVAKPLMITSTSANMNSGSSRIINYGTLYGFGTFLTALAVPLEAKAGSVIDLKDNAGQLRLWANAVFGAETGSITTVDLARGTTMTLEGSNYQFPLTDTQFAKKGFGTITCLTSATLRKNPGLGVCSSTVSNIPSTAFASGVTTPAPGSTGSATQTPGTTNAPGTTTKPGTTAAPGTTLAPGATETPGTTNEPGTTQAPGDGNGNGDGDKPTTTPVDTDGSTGSNSGSTTRPPSGTNLPTSRPGDSSSGIQITNSASSFSRVSSSSHVVFASILTFLALLL